jgi:hypothetical protein
MRPERQWLVVNVATLGLAVAFGAVGPLIGRIGARVFLRVGGRRAGSGQKQGRAGGQQQGVGAQAFHAAKVRPGGLKLKAAPRIFIQFALPSRGAWCLMLSRTSPLLASSHRMPQEGLTPDLHLTNGKFVC